MPEIIEQNLINDIKSHLKEYPQTTTEDISRIFGVRYSTAQWLLENLSKFIKSPVNNKNKNLFFYLKDNKLEVSKLGKHFLKILRNRVIPKRKLDQYLATETTMLRRLNFITYNQNLENKNILILGDDDFTSVGISLTFLPKKLVVIEKDLDIIKILRKIAKKENIKINVIKYDLRNGLPSKLKKQFDIVFADPPYTYRGALQFLRCARRSINNEGVIYFNCAYHQRIPHHQWLLHKILKFALNNNLVLIEMIHGFNSYEGNDGTKSSLLKFRMLNKKYKFPTNVFYVSELVKPIKINIKKKPVLEGFN